MSPEKKLFLYFKLFLREFILCFGALPSFLYIFSGIFVVLLISLPIGLSEETKKSILDFITTEEVVFSVLALLIIIVGFRIWERGSSLEVEILKNKVKNLIEINPRINDYKSLYQDTSEALQNLRGYMLGNNLHGKDEEIIAKIYAFLNNKEYGNNRKEARKALLEIKKLL